MKQTVHQDALLECIINSCQPQPNEEDFWALAIILVKSKHVIFARSGPLNEIAELTVKLIEENKIRIKEQVQILTFQGEKVPLAMRQLSNNPNILWPGHNLTEPFLILDPDYVKL
jgi:hypothetical protein